MKSGNGSFLSSASGFMSFPVIVVRQGNPYIFPGETTIVTLRLWKYITSEFISWFGTNFRVIGEDDETLTLRVRASLPVMRRWAVQYGVHAVVLSPESLREEIKTDIEWMMKNYGMETGTAGGHTG